MAPSEKRAKSFPGFVGCPGSLDRSVQHGETSGAILRFLQTQEAKLKDKLPGPQAEEDESRAEPTWLDEQDRLAEFESSQSERANDMTMKAIQKRRAANILRSYAEGIHAELEKLKAQPGDHTDQEMKLTVQLEANLARVALLHKQADLLRHQADLAKARLNTVHSAVDHSTILERDCNMLKIGPLFYSARSDDIDHKDRVPLMAKLNGNSLIIYHERKPQLTFYLVDIELPTKPVESAPSCFTFTYRGAEQALCAGTETSCHTWMNALTEAWFCRNEGIRGIMVSKNHTEEGEEDDNIKGDEEEDDGQEADSAKGDEEEDDGQEADSAKGDEEVDDGQEDDSAKDLDDDGANDLEDDSAKDLEDVDDLEDDDRKNVAKGKSKNGEDKVDKASNRNHKKSTHKNASIMKHAIKDKPKGLVNMEVYVDDKNKTHMVVNGKEKPVTATADLINFQDVLNELEKKKKGK
ncbi:hypothetical protein BaOVIS_018210 [Babesia ovis]|uniref:PH domain-containing protein n=1 Tax=Babesia ovis TaxID=5869 RepID=A0A9W5WVK7_BABOV|nr:hypothetical protein BaOVIS_018210 [Babesia ovis]